MIIRFEIELFPPIMSRLPFESLNFILIFYLLKRPLYFVYKNYFKIDSMNKNRWAKLSCCDQFFA